MMSDFSLWEGWVQIQSCVTRSFLHERVGSELGFASPTFFSSSERGFRLMSPDPFPHERVGSGSRLVLPDPFPDERVGSGSRRVLPDPFPHERVGLGTRQARLICNPASHHIPAETPLQS